MRRALLAASVLLLARSAAGAETGSAAEIEARLPTLGGLERVRALTTLSQLMQSDNPKTALEYGAQALEAAAPADAGLRSDILANMSWAHMQLSQYAEAVARGEESLRLATGLGDEARRAHALNCLGSIAQRRGDPFGALELFGQSHEAALAAGNDSELAMSLNNLGFVNTTDLADYGIGLGYHLEALAIRERLKDEPAIALSLNNIGIVYYRLKQYDQALDYFGRALALRRRLPPLMRLAATLHNIADVHRDLGHFEEALKAQQEALAIRSQIGDRSAVSFSHQAIGNVYLAMKRLPEAEREMKEALALGDAVGDKGLAASNRMGLAAVERQSGKPTQAVAHAQEAVDLAQQSGGRELKRRGLEELALAQEAAGRPTEALATYREFKKLNEDLLNDGTARRVASLEKRYEIEARERQMDRLVATRSRQRDAAAGALLVVGLGGFVWHRRRVERTRLAERLSVTDTLTGLKNRRYLDQTLGADAAASVRRHRAIAQGGTARGEADLVFFLVDLDHFKRINDTHGHDVGDRMLAGAARRLESACRESDVVVRWGGEEFLVVARFADRSQAAAQAERLRRSLADISFAHDDGRSLDLTGSIGFASFPFAPAEPEGLGWTQVVGIADYAAYLAKSRGRNTWTGLTLAQATLPPDRPTAETLDAWVANGVVAVESRS